MDFKFDPKISTQKSPEIDSVPEGGENLTETQPLSEQTDQVEVSSNQSFFSDAFAANVQASPAQTLDALSSYAERASEFWEKASPETRQALTDAGEQLKHVDISTDAGAQQIANSLKSASLSSQDTESAAFVIAIKTLKDFKEGFASAPDHVKSQKAPNPADSLKQAIDSMSEMGEMESLRLQMAMDRLSKFMTTLANILQKIQGTADSITQNLK